MFLKYSAEKCISKISWRYGSVFCRIQLRKLALEGQVCWCFYLARYASGCARSIRVLPPEPEPELC